MADGITDIQRNTPPWARGVPLDRWMRERGWVWDKGDADRRAEEWHASGQCAKRGKSCEWCEKRRVAAA